MKKNSEQHDNSMFRGAPSSSFGNAVKLRENMTAAEAVLWEKLKGHQLLGFKFRRQHPIQLYILDFYCHQLKLAIEVDGGYHLKAEQMVKDQERTKVLEGLGVNVLRFKNEEVLGNVEQVLLQIEDYIRSLFSTQ